LEGWLEEYESRVEEHGRYASMDRDKIASELVRLAKELIVGDGKISGEIRRFGGNLELIVFDVAESVADNFGGEWKVRQGYSGDSFLIFRHVKKEYQTLKIFEVIKLTPSEDGLDVRFYSSEGFKGKLTTGTKDLLGKFIIPIEDFDKGYKAARAKIQQSIKKYF